MITSPLKTIMTAAACLLVAAAGSLQAGSLTDSLKGGNLFTYDKNDLKPYDESGFDKVKMIAIYFSAHWCPPCREFTPELVQFYNKVKKNHPEFELIFCSSDKTKDAMVGYMKSANMPWPVLDYDKRSLLKKFGGGGIPNLVVLDENGQVLMSSYEGQQYVGPRTVVAKLDRQFSKERAAAKKTGTDFNDFFNKKPGEK
jgi:nucleoredoxin